MSDFVILKKMKRVCAFAAGVFLILSSLHAIVQPGDSLAKMRMELGEPTAQIQRGATMIYSYPQGGVHVENGVVVRLSEGFYGRADQILKQTADGTVEKPLTQGLFTDKPVADVVETPVGVNGKAVNNKPALVWFTDVEEAQQLSLQVQRPLLMVFTSPDDCEDCKELDQFILKDVAFADYAREKLVLLRMEYPKFSQLAQNIAEKRQIFKETWAVEQFPTMVMLGPNKKELGRMGYKYLPPEAFVIMLDQMALDGGQSAEAAGTQLLRDEFGDVVDQLLGMDGISSSALLLSAQIFVGCILAFLLIRRLMRK